MRYAYPGYGIDLAPELLRGCVDVGVRLLDEVGLRVRHERFLEAMRGKAGARVEGERVHFDEALVRENVDKYIAAQQNSAGLTSSADQWESGLQLSPEADHPEPQWTMRGGGFSMAVLDIETDEVRPATCRDLEDLIALVRSYGIEGNYPVMPQSLAF